MRWLFLVLLAGLGLRACNLDYGLDARDLSRAILSHQQDEEGMVRGVLSGAEADGFLATPSRGLLRGDPHPNVYLLWGSLGFWVFGAADAVAAAWVARGLPGGWDAALAALDGNPSTLHQAHRVVSVLAALLSLLVVQRLGRRVLGARGALLAAAIAAASYLPAREAHFGVLDTLAALGIVLAVAACVRLSQAPATSAYLLAGLCAGLAASAKYFGGVVALHVVLAHAWAQGGRPWRGLPRLLLAGAAAAAAFVAVSPQVLFWPDELLGALRHQRDTIGINLVDQSGGWPELALHHLRHTFVAGFGETALLFAALGALLLWRRGGAGRFLVLALVALLPLFFVARSPAVRYGIAPVLLLALPAAALCEEAAGVLVRRRWPAAAALALPLALCVAPSLLRAVSFNLLLGRPDTRTEALARLAELQAPREEVFAFGYSGLPRPGLVARWKTPYVDYLRVIQPGKVFTREEGALRRPRWLLRDETSSGADPWGWVDWVDTAATEYVVQWRLEPRRDPEAVRLPDKAAGTPSFYVPFDNPWQMARPGPVLTLYERLAP
jgi:hypothetical protein